MHMAGPRSVTDDDREIGARLRWARGALSATRRDFAQVLGVSAQQVLKYELGHSRISAGQLVAIARAFKIPFSRLFGEDAADMPVPQYQATIQLFRDFNMLDADLQGAVVKLTRTLASRTQASKQS
jgi:transcriptional regulator with XRE-family HTH domain